MNNYYMNDSILLVLLSILTFFFFLGAGVEGNVHHPKFAPDDEILRYGGWLLSAAAVRFLEKDGLGVE